MQFSVRKVKFFNIDLSFYDSASNDFSIKCHFKKRKVHLISRRVQNMSFYVGERASQNSTGPEKLILRREKVPLISRRVQKM